MFNLVFFYAGKLPIQRLKPGNLPASQPNAQFPPGANAARATPPAAAGGQQKKTAHNAIERRYRNNINDRIAELKNAVPALLHARLKDSSRKRRTMDDDDDDGDDGEEYLDGVAVATKLNKATILRKATEYITHLKRTGDDMRQENALLQHLLAQLPGGQDVLSQYRMQKMQREQDMLQQQRLQQQQQQSASKRRKQQRKRTRTSDEDESSSSTTGSSPSTPPLGVSSRVFMAVFMAISLFSSSPLTSGPTSTEQFQNHHHMSRAATPDISTASTSHERFTTTTNATSGGLLDDVNGWAVIRTTVFVVCLVQLLLPLVKAWAGHMSYRVKRVPRRRRMFRKSGAALAAASSANAVSPGDQKCTEVYRILVRQLAQEHDDGLPLSMLPIHVAMELFRLAGRHMFGYEVYDERRDPQDEWEQACYWLKLCEIQILGGNPDATRWHRLYSCLRMLNLVEHLIDDEHAEVRTLRARAYVTAAMEFSLNGAKGRFARHFWRQALIETSYMDEDDDLDETDGSFMWALMWKDYPREDWIFDTLAWKETLEVMRGDRLSLSLTAPVIVPVTILSTLHLMESLKDQFRVLIKQITTSSDVVPGFESLLAASEVQEQQRLAHWLAAVGMTVEALWKQDIKQAEQWMPAVARRVPRALLVALPGREALAQKTRMSQLDELVKKQMILTLAGALALLQNTAQGAEEGVARLEEAERVRDTMRRVRQSKVREYGIENTVMARAEFAVAMVGLDAWLRAWKWSKQDTRQQVRQATWHLRRMTKRSVLSEHQVLIDRLVRLDRFVARQTDGVDSACDCTEDEELEEPPTTAAVAYDLVLDDESIAKRADRALDILHGA